MGSTRDSIRLGEALLSAAGALRRRLDAEAVAASSLPGVTGARALGILAEGGSKLTALATQLGMTKQAASEVVERLLAGKFIEKQPDPGDGRALRLVLTDHGRAAIRHHQELVARTIDPLEQVLGPKKFDRLLRYLAAADKVLHGSGGENRANPKPPAIKS